MSDTNDAEMNWPATGLSDVAPDDNADLDPLPRALWVGAQGDLSVEMKDGSIGTLAGAVGLIPIRVRKVRSTGTNAGSIVALY